jgi:hypothetical protein
MISVSNLNARRTWVGVALGAAALYPLIGVLFALPTSQPAAPTVVLAWRLAAWLASAGVFMLHLWFELRRRGTSTLPAAIHVAFAVAVGAFLLAVWILVRAHWIHSATQSRLAPLALVLFPLVTGLPAFLGALAAGAVYTRLRSHRPRSDA